MVTSWVASVLDAGPLLVDTDAWSTLLEQTTFGLRIDAQGRLVTHREPLTPLGQDSLRTREPRWVHERDKAVLSLPLMYQNFEILFEGLAPAGREWLEEDREIVRQTLEQLALALQDAYLFTSTQQALAEVERLYKVTSQLLEGTEFVQALQVLAEHTVLGQAQALYLYLSDFRLGRRAATDATLHFVLEARWPTDAADDMPDEMVLNPVHVPQRLLWALPPDAPELPPEIHPIFRRMGAASVTVAPLIIGGDLLGALVAVFASEPPAVPPREQRILGTSLRQVAGYVRSLALQENLRFTLDLTNRLYRIALGLSQAETFDEIMQVMWKDTPLGQGALAASCVLFEPPMTETQRPTWLVTASVLENGRPVAARWRRLSFASAVPPANGEGPHLVEGTEGEAVLQQTFLEGRPYIIRDAESETVLSREFLQAYRQNIPARSGILLPLRVGDAVVGMIAAAYPDERTWTQEELQVMLVAAAQAAVRARSLYLLWVSERRASQLETASVIARDIGRTLSLETLLKRAVDLIRERFGFYHATVFLLDDRGEYAEARAATGEAGRVMLRSGHKLRVGSQSVVGQTAARGEPVVVNDVRSDPVHRPNPLLPETLAEAGFPLRVGDRVIGVLDVQSKDTFAFTPDDVQVLQLLADQLAVAVENARAYELARRALQDMRRADELKSQFLASMSHELRTPLNSIIGFSRIILKGIDGPITDLQRQDLEAIFKAGQHLLGLINDILDLSKIEAGKMELNFAEVDIAQVIQDVLATTQALVKDKPVRLETDLAPDLPPLRVDPKRFRQILLNLLSNAAKFTKEGYIRVRAYREMDPLTAYSEVVIAVEDTGPGIPPEHLERLFQPFYQVDSSLTREAGGTGLGLAITRNLVELHGGRIWVESQPGQGSTFYVAFPVTPTETTDLTEDFLLVYDHNPDTLRIMRRHFAVKGYRVVQVTHLEELLARAQALRPLAVFVNPFLPRKMGIEAVLELKKREETRYLPTSLLAVDVEREEMFSPHWHVMLTKPLRQEDVAYLRSMGHQTRGRWVLMDRHPQHLEYMVELLQEAGVSDIVVLHADENPDTDAAEPLVFIWDMLAPMPGEAFRRALQSLAYEGPERHLIVGLLDAQMDAEAWERMEDRLHELKQMCSYPMEDTLHYLEGLLYYLAAQRAAAEAE